MKDDAAINEGAVTNDLNAGSGKAAVNDILVSFREAAIRTADLEVLPALNLDIKKGEQLALTGANETFRNGLLYALAGKTSIAHGTVNYPFYKDFLKEHPVDDPLFSPHKLFAVVGPRHSFKTLNNTRTGLYYQQRYNALDTDDALMVEAWLSQIPAVVSPAGWTLARVIAELQLAPHLKKRVIQLSNGETKRVLIAAAILRNPVLLLLDNPLTGLDAGSREEIKELIDHLGASGITIVLNTAADDIPSCISRILVFKEDNSIHSVNANEQEGSHFTLPDPQAQTFGFSIPETEVKALFADQKSPAYQYIVNMRNVSVRYGERQVLERINWTVRQGERWALLGHNGAGKTTLLSLVNGDNPQAYANDIVLFDRKRGTGESIWDIKQRIGFMSAELYQYFPIDTSCLSAVESGFYDTTGLFRKSIPANREKALQWMKLLGIEDLSGKLLKNLSPVNQRLCLLARALVKSPSLLILDEPCQGFDRGHQLNFRALLDLICRYSNITLVYVTHYLDELPQSVQHFLRLEHGRVVSST